MFPRLIFTVTLWGEYCYFEYLNILNFIIFLMMPQMYFFLMCCFDKHSIT